MFTSQRFSLLVLLIWNAWAILISLVGLYLCEYFGVSFVTEAGGRVT
jgi:hypothetical protein